MLTRLGLDELGEAEVEDADVPVFRDHHVLGLEVPVNDAGLVRARKTVGDLDGDIEELLDGQRARLNELAKSPAFDELHRDVDGAVGTADVVDVDDVGMIQAGGRARFLLEAPPPFGVRREVGRQHLQRDIAAQPAVVRAVDLAHPARGNRRNDVVASEARARSDCHVRWGGPDYS